MKKNKNVSLARIGMSKDIAPDSLQDQNYVSAINMNIENESGNLLKLKSEHSNLLASKFISGYKVVGFESDINTGSTFFFLTNPETSNSEIGVIQDNANIDLISDLEAKCPGCNFKRILGAPLEESTQTEYLTYTTIIEDSCNQCLNFKVEFPIKKVIIKNEKSGIKIFFSDNLNPPRYLDMNRIGEYAYTGDIVCDTDNTVPTCVACDKLRMFPIYTPIRIKPEEIILGGNLPLGQYSFYASYVNRLGDEMSEYTSLTNPVSIFDDNNKIQTNEEKDDNTNYAIKLNVDYVDKDFSYYKIVVAYSNIVDGGTRYFEVGTFPVTTQDILFNTTADKKEISIDNILIPNANIKLLEGLAESNNYLFGYGVTKEKEWNLQPITNLLGGFFKWQTHIAKEDLYEGGVNNSLYKTYMRDEVYPLAIAFKTDFGYTTARFPLIARPPLSSDLEVVDNLDTQSIAANISSCSGNVRNERWQFYNTATEIGTCSSDISAGNFEIGIRYKIIFVGTTDFTLIGATSNIVGEEFVATGAGTGTGIASLAIPTNVVVEPISKVCTIDSVVTAAADSFIIDDPEFFTGLEDFINNTLEEGNCFGYPFCGVIDPGLYADCTPDFTNCDTPVLEVEYLKVNSIVNEVLNTTYVNFPDDYSKLRLVSPCSPDRRDASGGFVEDLEFQTRWINGSSADEWNVFERVDNLYNNAPAYSEELGFLENPNQGTYSSYYFLYKGYDGIDLTTALNNATINYNSLATATITGYQWVLSLDYTFFPKISKESLWFNVDMESKPTSFITEITKLVQDEVGKTVSTFNSNVRVNILDSKASGSTAIYSNILNLESDGLQLLVDLHKESIDATSTVSGNYYKITEVGTTDFTLIGASSNTVGVKFLATGVGVGDGKVEENFLIIKESDIDVGTTPIEIPKDIYIVVDAPLAVATGTNTDPGYYTVPLKGCFGLGIRPIEIESIGVSYDSIVFDKVQKYIADCNFEVPLVSDCGVVPYKYGDFAFWKSEQIYPDNKELYDSSKLIINSDDFYTVEAAEEFESKYSSGKDAEGLYVLTEETNFTCKAIRHYKFPDNAVSPFMYENAQAGFVKSIVYPIGVTVDENIINNFLDIAVNNGLISQQQRDSIIGYEIFRGDRTLNKGVIAKGLVYDMYSYKEKEKDILFSNFPYNSLGDNELFFDDDTRENSINHPYNSNSNYNFTFHSPDTEFVKPAIPSEMKVEGYSFGKSKGVFDEVEGHPKYVILGREARRLASTLATLEVIAEVAVIAAQSAEVYRFDGGFVFSANPVGIGLNLASVALNAIGSAVFKYGRYKYEWLNTFRNLGSPENFAYFYTSVGEYNYLQTLQSEEQSLRGILKSTYLPSGRFTIVNEVDGEKLEINNADRERSVFLTIGAGFPLTYPTEYKDYDNQNSNSDLSSRFTQSNTLDCTKGRSKEFVKNIASPYISLKNYLPSQYGGIDNIDWVTTSYFGDLNNPDSSCLKIFGGDTFISRHTLKRKAPMFLDSAVDLASLTPFNYRSYSNIGEQPRYYANFLSPDEISLDRGMPDISTEYKFDCLIGDRDFYVKQPSKFYLYYYGIPSFLTETLINTNYRTGKPALKDLFYPLVGDYVEWTQEKNVSIKERNNYFYSSIYSSNPRISIGRTLPATYNKTIYDTLYDAPNGVIYSLPDNNENELTEPWLVFKPLDKYEFSSSYGKLVELRGIETQQMLGRFENQSAIFNAVDVLVDGINESTNQLGTGGIFARRPVTFADTDLGYAGSQSFDMVSCEYGHFYTDTKRGQVFQIMPGGKGIVEISSNINGNPSGMKNWFKEHLPFKVLNNKVENYQDIDVDNPYNGLGVAMGWDSRYKRVFLTKKDYKPLKPLVWACDGFYNPDLTKYTEVISEYEGNGFELDGVEDCRLKFSKASITTETDIYAFFDTTSMQVADGQSAADALNTWFTNYQILNPEYTGSLYIIPYSNEQWASFGSKLITGAINPTLGTSWSPIAQLPPNLNTGSWVAPTDVIVLAFVDESHSQYHSSSVADGFGSIVQPTTTYTNDFNQHVTDYSSFTYFQGILYPIVQQITGAGGALVLQGLAAIEGTTLTPAQITATGTTVDVSILETTNPYSILGGLKDYGWSGVWDKVSPASSVFNSASFSEELDSLILGGVDAISEYEFLDKIELHNVEFFEDVSWTVAYSLTSSSWISYYDFHPNYYINHNNYFQTGINVTADITEFGLWSHLLTNKSFGVFYGKKYEIGLEYPIINSYTSKTLESIELWTEALRYHNNYDFAYSRDINFNKLIISNNRETTGNLVLVPQKTLRDNRNYPKTYANHQEILMTNSQDRWKLNHIYNRVDSEYLNQPIWSWDVNQIKKSLNNKLVKFKGKRVLERLRGDFFLTYLGYDLDSRYEVSFKWAVADEDLN